MGGRRRGGRGVGEESGGRGDRRPRQDERRPSAPGGARGRAGRLAGALAAPVAPATAAALAPGRAALRAALLRAGATPTREIPQLRAALERLGLPASTDGCASPRSTGAAEGA